MESFTWYTIGFLVLLGVIIPVSSMDKGLVTLDDYKAENKKLKECLEEAQQIIEKAETARGNVINTTQMAESSKDLPIEYNEGHPCIQPIESAIRKFDDPNINLASLISSCKTALSFSKVLVKSFIAKNAENNKIIKGIERANQTQRIFTNIFPVVSPNIMRSIGEIEKGMNQVQSLEIPTSPSLVTMQPKTDNDIIKIFREEKDNMQRQRNFWRLAFILSTVGFCSWIFHTKYA